MKERLLSRKGIFWCLCLITGIVSAPLLTDYVMTGSSLRASLSRIEVISQGLGSVFPVRVIPLETLDYGYAAASLQADLFYLFPAVLHAAGMNVINAYKWTLFFLNGAAAAIAYGCFKGVCEKREIGLLCSALYTWCPYRCSQLYLTGDLGETAAWSVLPLTVCGLILLYRSDEQKNGKKAYLFLVWGASLLIVSHTAVAFAALVMALVFFLAMGKRTWVKSRLWILCKAFGTVILVNAWFLIPTLSRLHSKEAVEAMLLPDVKSMGMYLPQYFQIFSWGQDGVKLVENGMKGAQAMGPGIAVIVLILLGMWYLGARESGHFLKTAQEGMSVRRLLCVCVCLMALSSNFFPWDLLQNQNRICSALLALLYTPAKLGIVADACLIAAAGVLLSMLWRQLGEKSAQYVLCGAAVVSWLTTQFLLGQILISRQFLRPADWEMTERLPFLLVPQESMLWRLGELISALALVGLAALWLARGKFCRRKMADFICRAKSAK